MNPKKDRILKAQRKKILDAIHKIMDKHQVSVEEIAGHNWQSNADLAYKKRKERNTRLKRINSAMLARKGKAVRKESLLSKI